MSVGAKHLEDKLSVIAKNSSPNASPVQLSVVSCHWKNSFSLHPYIPHIPYIPYIPYIPIIS
ncbi:hypothetical protein [Dolichospermum flos-aquae]|uniref:Uncharacterized protein n=1 Tax=Dolichospermum flos-aquae CCAP 1403/13F TaxID=315271 RepID=A0A6H2BV41_DOLFA|nr:hypothetical protein [Dolichospermum flos-aquae]QJB42836.1 hypothetical protein HGD76_07805 [Dolichospermum flos-aquae CCAP 1403/13F]